MPELVTSFFLIIFVLGLSSSTSNKNNVSYFSAEEIDNILGSKEEFNVILASSVDGFGQRNPFSSQPGQNSQPSRQLFGSSSSGNPESLGSGSNSDPSGAGSGSKNPISGPVTKLPFPWFYESFDQYWSETKAEKEKCELRESIEAKKIINAQRRKRGLPELTVIVKDGKQYFAPRDQVRKKYYHFPKVFKSKPPSELSGAVLDKLVDPTITTYENRRRVLDSPSLLPQASVVEAANDMRKALINSDTVVKQGTFGGNMKKRGKIGEVINGSIFYNKKKNQATFFGPDGFKTSISPLPSEWNDILNNNNML